MLTKHFFRYLSLLFFFTTISVGAQEKVTEIWTDYNGYWTSSATNINTTKPDNSHHLLAFKYGETIYSTGVKDAVLRNNNVNFTPAVWQAFPIATVTSSGSGYYVGLGQLYDGVNNGASSPAPFTGSNAETLAQFLTDGINGLDLGTGLANIPNGQTLRFKLSANAIAPSAIGDGVPDIIFAQIASPNASGDKIKFVNNSNNRVGTEITFDLTSEVNYPKVGQWEADFYNVNGSGVLGGELTRDIRFFALDLSELGITNANYTQVSELVYTTSGHSDPAFIAYNEPVIDIPGVSIQSQPSFYTNGTVMSPAFVVALEDKNGDILTTSGISIKASIYNSSGSLTGTKEVQTGSDGKATFSNLTITGSGTHQVKFSNPNYNPAISSYLNCSSTPSDEATITIVSSGGTSCGWSVINGVLSAQSNVSINASEIEKLLINGNLLIEATGKIDINSNIRPALRDNTTLTFKSKERITLNSGSEISPTIASLNVVFWSDSDNDNNDGGVSIFGNITTNGGHLWAGGSSTDNGSYTWNELVVGNGPSVGVSSQNNHPLDLYGNISTAGGDILIWASDQRATDSNSLGIGTDSNGATLNTGSGDVILIADQIKGGEITLNSTGHLYLLPYDRSYPSSLTWSHSGTTDWNVNDTYNNLTIKSASNLGGLTLGHYSGMNNNGSAVVLGNSSDISLNSTISISGPITLNGNDISLNSNGTLSSSSGNINTTSRYLYLNGTGSDALTATTGDITINFAELANLNNNHLKFSNRGVSAKNIKLIGRHGYVFILGSRSNDTFGLTTTDIQGLKATNTLTIGPEPNTGSGYMQISESITSSHITETLKLQHKTIQLSATVNLPSRLFLNALTSAYDDTNGSLSASELVLEGPANFTFDRGNGVVSKVAAGTSEQLIGNLTIINNDQIEVGSINPSGIKASGVIEIATLSGNLLITEPIVSTLSTGDSVKLYSDKDAVVGEVGDGQIKISSNGAVTIESGARALFYSGKELESSGVKTAIGGEANIRYDVSANTDLSTLDPAISASGSFGLFRIDNLIDFTVTSQDLEVSKVYDGTNTATITNIVVSGKESGDDVSVTATATYDNANTGSGKTITVVYTLLGNDANKYKAIPNFTTNSGEITKKELTASASSVSKEYDGTTAMSGVRLGLTGLETGDVVTVNGTGAFDSPNVGTGLGYTISGLSLAGADAGNYSLAAEASFSGTNGEITTASLTVTANDDNGVDTDPPYAGGNGVVYSGFKNAETASVLSGVLTYSGSSQGATTAGTYSIVPGGLTSSNYSITFVAGTLTIVVGDSDGDGVRDPSDNCPTTLNADQADADGDGVGDLCDNAPNTPNPDQRDTDGDGIGDVADPDDDNDGCPDTSDDFPLDPSECADTDGDGIGNNADTDDDNDGVLDTTDNCAFTPNSDQSDIDADGIGDVCDTDIDGDGWTNEQEQACGSNPTNATDTLSDFDRDGLPDCSDPDDDNDGVEDENDTFPLDPSEWIDTDADGTGNNTDLDDDNDRQIDEEEIFCGTDPLDASSFSGDIDGDGITDCRDTDNDNDGVQNAEDAFPLDPTEWTDTDADGTGNNADTDDDGDGYSDLDELECNSNPLDPRDTPKDQDQDGIADCIDEDRDGDGVLNTQDVFPDDPSESVDTDGDGLGDNFEVDKDGDGVLDVDDAFPLDPNEWADEDGDGIGDNADPDVGNDGFDDEKVLASGVLTPNSSGMESTWKIVNIEQYPNARVRVYNKNAQEVFNAINYKNDWRGTFKGSDQMLVAGSYYFIIDLNNGAKAVSGWLYLIY